jgi:hypothetical protein
MADRVADRAVVGEKRTPGSARRRWLPAPPEQLQPARKGPALLRSGAAQGTNRFRHYTFEHRDET